ncbi:MAG: type III-B CRISPR module RAMP protein Cmr1 [Deltaproteobacteria bacterium]|nr:MAG: type III-B CRISPR module RAMP protein Cmr1 [Deltaproteobacteria bacterium]
MSTPSPAPIRLDQSRITTLEVPFRFLTWVFGGGVKHNPNTTDSMEPMRPFDPVTPVRSSGVRGQLRFWWRATTGARLGSLGELKRREAEVWGGIWGGEPTHGKVGLTVEKTGGDNPTPVPTFQWGRSNFPRPTNKADGIAYGAFPMRPQGNIGDGEEDVRSVLWDHGDLRYRLLLTVPPELNQEIRLAVSAWLAFGGYGARLTRGFGAVALDENATQTGLQDDPDAVLESIRRLEPPRLKGVPAIDANPERFQRARARSTPIEGWKAAIQNLQQFRQGLNLGRNKPGPNARHGVPAGRSRWPEPDELRRVTRRSDPDHRQPVNQGGAFPRADFGLPIIFHFNSNQDPPEQTLQIDRTTDRLPSPVILNVTRGGEPIALWLRNADAPEELHLKGADTSVRKTVSEKRLQELAPHHQKLIDPSPVAAFLKHFS